jgi:hypothetical protein
MAALAAAAAGVALLAASGASGSESLEKPGVVRLTASQVKRVHVDIGNDKRRVGDFVYIRQLLYNRRVSPKALGHSEMSCTMTGDGSSTCSATYFLPKGKIVVGGVFRSRLFYELAVLGGTGLYDNVRGTMTVTSLGGRASLQLLLFRLTI